MRDRLLVRVAEPEAQHVGFDAAERHGQALVGVGAAIKAGYWDASNDLILRK
jgi:hypothetical protein